MPVAPVVACPICGATMSVEDDSRLPEFGTLDIRLHRLGCENCGMEVERAFHPSVGYKPITR